MNKIIKVSLMKKIIKVSLMNKIIEGISNEQDYKGYF